MGHKWCYKYPDGPWQKKRLPTLSNLQNAFIPRIFLSPGTQSTAYTWSPHFYSKPFPILRPSNCLCGSPNAHLSAHCSLPPPETHFICLSSPLHSTQPYCLFHSFSIKSHTFKHENFSCECILSKCNPSAAIKLLPLFIIFPKYMI